MENIGTRFVEPELRNLVCAGWWQTKRPYRCYLRGRVDCDRIGLDTTIRCMACEATSVEVCTSENNCIADPVRKACHGWKSSSTLLLVLAEGSIRIAACFLLR